MTIETKKSVVYVKNRQIVLFAVALAFFYTLFQQWDDFKQGFVDGLNFYSQVNVKK